MTKQKSSQERPNVQAGCPSFCFMEEKKKKRIKTLFIYLFMGSLAQFLFSFDRKNTCSCQQRVVCCMGMVTVPGSLGTLYELLSNSLTRRLRT